MADVILTKGGLKSQAPEASGFVGSITRRRGGSGGSSSVKKAEEAKKAAEERAIAEAARLAEEKRIATQEAERSRIARQEAELKQKLVNKLILDNKRRGILTSRDSAQRVVNARIQSEKRRQVVYGGEVQAVPRQTGIAGKIQQLNDLQKRKATTSIRTKQKNLANELSLLGLTVGRTLVEGGQAFVALPRTLVSLARNPSQLKQIPSAIANAGQEFGQVVKISPTEALGRITGEVLLLKGTGKVFEVTGKVGGRAANELNPFLKRIKGGKLNIKTSAGKTTLRVGGPVSKIQEPLTEQARLAGKRVVAVSAQADKIPAENVINFLKQERIVRKPIPNEASLSKSVKKLLDKFDKGTINKNELKVLQDKVPVLERSFFADPRGRFRPSRLGLQEPKRASLLDVLSGDVTFKSPKPQILVFSDTKVAKFPQGLKDVEEALKKGKTLSSSQARRLLNWQSKQTGEFKPIGALTREPEITLAPGEIIKKVRKRGTALVNGKRVDIVEVKVVKAKPRTKELLLKSKKGKLTSKELKILRRELKKETGFDTNISRSINKRPRARILKRVIRSRRVDNRKITPTRKRRILKNLEKARTARGPTKTKRTTRGKGIPKRTQRTPRTTRRTTRTPRTTRRTTRRGGGGRSPPPPTIRPLKNFRSRTLNKRQQTYYVVTKKRGKMIKLYPRPLTLKDAKDYLAYSVDNNLTKTAFFIPLGKSKKVVKPPKEISGYFQKASKKLRPYRIKYGKKKELVNGYIEKRKYAFDTPGERGQARRLIRKSKQTSKTTTNSKPRKVVRSNSRPTTSSRKRRITTTQRRKMLANLKKARAVRMRKLKRKK